MTAAKNHPRVRVLGVDDLCWELAPAPWPKSRPVLELALDALGVIEDELARAVIARLATTIVDQTDQPVRIEEWSENGHGQRHPQERPRRGRHHCRLASRAPAMPVTPNCVLRDATRLIAQTYYGDRGTRAYDTFEAINSVYFSGELPWPQIIWALTPHGHCLGQTLCTGRPHHHVASVAARRHGQNGIHGRFSPRGWDGGTPSMSSCTNAC